MRLLHYAVSLIVHLVSGGLGRRAPGAIPLARGKSLPITPLPTWQIIVALWLFRKLWRRYGGGITQRAAQKTAAYSGPGAGMLQEFLHTIHPESTSQQASSTVTVDPISHQAESQP